MVNYANSKIYKIEPLMHEDGDFVIGGKTKKYLSSRMVEHRKVYDNYLKGNTKYKTNTCKLFEKYGVDYCMITLIESVELSNKNELE